MTDEVLARLLPNPNEFRAELEAIVLGDLLGPVRSEE